ncbi:MAG: helix-turn-helix domain-containing protein [Phycisphaerae bacterium]|nr:helix-turn-helix domain-containing protein [Phycisphaerae bacterium]
MKIEGRIVKSGKWWAAEVPMLLTYTQGQTKKKAYAMIKDAIECLVDEPGFSIEVSPGNEKGTICIASSDDRTLMAFALKQQRAEHCLSVRDVARNLGSKSPTAYSRYESGRVGLTLDKFSQLLRAIDPDLEPVLKF